MKHRIHLLLNLLVALAIVLPWSAYVRPVGAIPEKSSSDTGIYRTSVTLPNSAARARLDELGVTVLAEGVDTAIVLATAGQLETLARLRFQPQASDDLGLLVETNGRSKPWLLASLSGALASARQAQTALDSDAVTAEQAEAAAQAVLDGLTPEQEAGILGITSVDDDGDGLTNTEEAWWCTDPMNQNSDGDAQNYTDGQEVAALLDFTLPRSVRWGYGAPFGPPNAWPDWNGVDGNPDTPACNDGDWDTIPDYAEAYIVGSRTPDESTDNDKFDDGQELFGITYCPGAPTNCGYGSYPAVEYWNFITAEMPDWVEPPGDNLFVAAFPVPEVSVVAGSWTVERVTTITTQEGQMTETTNSYATSVTEGQSTSIADTVTWNEWEEVSESVETPLNAAAATPDIITSCTGQGFWCYAWGGVKLAGGVAAVPAGAILAAGGALACPETLGLGCAVAIGGGALATSFGPSIAQSGWDDLFGKDESQNAINANIYNSNTNINNVSASAESNVSVTLNNNFDTQGMMNSLDGIAYAINQQGSLLARGLYDISYQISRPRYTETHTNGRSWGGSQTTTHEVYEEHTITEGEAFTTGQNWSTAWAVDSSHAADLTFDYTVENTGTEYAREIGGLIFNIYLGDDSTPIISYPAWQQFSGGTLDNVFPGDSHTFSSNPVPLTLEQMKRIDLGEKLTVVMEPAFRTRF